MSAKDNSMKAIPSKLEQEIGACLGIYFKDTARFSSIYWPRSLRGFLVKVLSKIREFSELWEKLKLDEERLTSLIEELTSTYVCVKDRKLIGNCLREVLLHHKEYGFKLDLANSPPLDTEENEKWDWPDDIVSYLDLTTSIANVSIRRDVSKYLHHLIRTVVGKSVGYKIHYDVPMIVSDKNFFP
mmetsp:Transcript_8207/g.12244  ORF Transcript_8207/g.12244 Transcript_8207/m.12244 type:complete len:185 (+) Transcript_8207:81-635(+)|eukprot:CAMPEP_0170087562 /NCGR_PEP_ID=MMETSP0019_2-20121128/22017_1 /TAXON_ID=98059 /ORGANISM="Dinobryon sp., Strain UTEXLB2267" /LENGTH=184 /DNA_ID=CAMNT_0010305291 /DNA_START=18 /DNA_END=575 /DNA_ORIENTATION=+